MLIWLCVLLISFGFRVVAKTGERKAADKLTLSIYRGKNEAAVALASTLIERPTPVNELGNQIVDALPPLSLLVRVVYTIFAFSLVTPDSRTPNSFTLWESEQKIYELHDPDLHEAYRVWKTAFFWDGVSAGVLVLIFTSTFSKSLFTFLYR